MCPERLLVAWRAGVLSQKLGCMGQGVCNVRDGDYGHAAPRLEGSPDIPIRNT